MRSPPRGADFDEVQTGVGRTGELYAYIIATASPDLLTTAKAGRRIPDRRSGRAKPCQRDGHPRYNLRRQSLACAVAGEVLSIINTPQVLNGVKQREQWFKKSACRRLTRSLGCLKIRGVGLLIGCATR